MFTWYGEDIGAFNSKLQQDIGFGTYDLGEVVNEFVTRSGGRCFPAIVKSYVHNSGPTLDHMLEVAKEMGVDPKAYTYDNTPEGWLIMQANMDYEKIQAGNDMYDCLRYDYPMTPGTKTWGGHSAVYGAVQRPADPGRRGKLGAAADQPGLHRQGKAAGG